MGMCWQILHPECNIVNAIVRSANVLALRPTHWPIASEV